MLKYNIEQQIAKAQLCLAAVDCELAQLPTTRNHAELFNNLHKMQLPELVSFWKVVKAERKAQQKRTAILEELAELQECLALHQKLSNRFGD